MAAELLTLEQAKKHLRVSYDEDDEEIQELILTAEAYIDGCVGAGYKDKANYESEEEYEKGRRIAALLLKKIVSDMYEVRQAGECGGVIMYLVIQKRKKTVEKGRPVETWEDYHKCWCDVKSLYGKELYSALEAKLENVVNFETRFCLKLEALNTKEYRVKWGERMFNIIAADYGKYNRRKIVIKAQEIV